MRQKFCANAADALDNAATNELSHQRKLSSVLNVIDASTASAGEQERAQRRTEWHLKVHEAPTSIKPETADMCAADGKASGQPSMDALQATLAQAVTDGVAAGLKQQQGVMAGTRGGCFAPGKRVRGIGSASALSSDAAQSAENRAPSAPNQQFTTQTSTNKATASKELASAAKQRSSDASKTPPAPPPEPPAKAANDDSSDDEGAHNPQPNPPRTQQADPPPYHRLTYRASAS